MSMVHPMARTTPRTRAEIHDSAASVAELAQAYNISRSTARKWRNRDDLLDRSHKAHQLHTTLSPAQELIVMEIRRLCLLPLDDLVAVTKQFINADASRSGVSRLLRREGLSKLSDLEPRVEGEETSRKTFKDYEPGFVHIDIKFLPKMPDEAQHSYLFVAIDRATRWVFMRIYADQTQGSAVDFLRRVHEAAAFKITKLLTDNGTQFTDRFTSKNKQASGRHSFDRQCKALEIEHRLSPPRRPQTNGMVERFNGRISEVIKQTRFASAAELASTLNNYWQAYNHHIPQRALGHVSPVDSLKNWHQKKPELFRKRIYKQAELDTYNVLFPAILFFCCIGTYSINNNLDDVFITVAFGALGYLFMRLEMDPSPLMLGFILGPMLEENFRRSMLLSRGSFEVFINRPISGTLISLIAAFILWQTVSFFRQRGKAKELAVAEPVAS